MKAQTLAATNKHLKRHVHSVLVEVMQGVSRQRHDTQTWHVHFVARGKALIAEVRAADGGHAGAWMITPRAL